MIERLRRWRRQRRVSRKVQRFVRLAVSRGWTTARAIQVDELPHGTVLAIAPHVDDEAIGCGGALLLHQDAGDAINLVYALHDPNRQAEREAEAAHASAMLGARSVTHLRSAQDVEQIAEGLRPLFLTHKPSMTYVPWGLDNHEGHLAVAHAVARLVASGVPCGQLWCYEVWTPLVPNKLVDITRVLERKQTLLEGYKSQLQSNDIVSMGIGLSRYRGGRLRGRLAIAAEAFLALSSSEYQAVFSQLMA